VADRVVPLSNGVVDEATQRAIRQLERRANDLEARLSALETKYAAYVKAHP
jgi:hypothetical protein